MKKDEFYVLNCLYNGSCGRAKNTADIESMKAINSPKIIQTLVKAGLISKDNSLTEAGIQALEPYRVNNAIILDCFSVNLMKSIFYAIISIY